MKSIKSLSYNIDKSMSAIKFGTDGWGKVGNFKFGLFKPTSMGIFKPNFTVIEIGFYGFKTSDTTGGKNESRSCDKRDKS